MRKYFQKKKKIKTYLIKKNFIKNNTKKNKIRNEYLKRIKFHIPTKVDKIINNKNILKSVNEILEDFC